MSETDRVLRDAFKAWLTELPDAERAALIAEVTSGSAGGEEPPPADPRLQDFGQGRAHGGGLDIGFQPGDQGYAAAQKRFHGVDPSASGSAGRAAAEKRFGKRGN
ncbi:hypothetical protein [Mycobacterium sp. TY813]|uniref:hypothetical protein n=1 Tax=Mycobacterium TaxID=1763 RepID=UPI002742042B|nr:hypothetical protein [Mycobacterium sp. TY813]MDP7731506.1 hypothetical protein [Mycobacterium sp. TY813]